MQISVWYESRLRLCLDKLAKLVKIRSYLLTVHCICCVTQKPCKNHFYSDFRNGTEISKDISGKLHSYLGFVVAVV